MAASTVICTLFSSSLKFRTNCCFRREAPWLTLPPVFEGGDLVYKFYKLKDKGIESIPKRRIKIDLDLDLDIPPDDAKLVGSSHGWLAFYDENTTHVFLSNPISRRHIKLPRIDTLPNPEFNMFGRGRHTISRVILSTSSPGDGTCRAITTFGPGRRLAYCVPGPGGLSTEWTPLGDAINESIEPQYNIDRVQYAMPPKEDFVYCAQRGVLTSIAPLEFRIDYGSYSGRKDGDLIFDGKEDSHSTIWDCSFVDRDLSETAYIYGLEKKVKEIWNGNGEGKLHLEMLARECIQMPHIFYAEDLSPDPLILLRFVHRGIGYNASPADPKLAHPDLYRAMIDTFPYKTVCFLLLHTIGEIGQTCRVVKDLRGLAIFVGMNHSFAIPAKDFPGILKPNSIYFTDACRMTSDDDPPDATKIYGGHDIGVFDYETETISPCYYPCDFQNFQRIDPPPMWFTPNPN